ncbi:MAG: SDR family NAD(P)-dependent oxidoreductase [Planctomycetota bacterium]|nr:SDR family NAD(P)-dependent oxidoreductase [Planctomycetota bacterium]
MTAPCDREEWSGFELAIVGMAGRFPGARDVDAFWRNLRDGVESITFPSEEELLAAGEDPARLRDPNYVRATSALKGIDRFDAAFFGITPGEAQLMDPQHRLFLETAWNALEDAGYDPSRCPGPVGVYGGSSTNTYLLHNLVTADEAGGLPALFGNQTDYLTTRVSYKLDLTGPSFGVQTSCSSSLVAVHLAGQALLAGECDLALAGGVAVAVPQGRGYIYQQEGIYSPDGHCRAFSADARGTVGGSGVAVVALRRLQDALAAGDCIRAVIKGSAINNDGSGKVGYAAPSVGGQMRVIRDALALANVHPESVSYVEAHGTGTSLGDPIEIAALTAAFRAQTKKKAFCAIGSVKTNIGHLDAAAGVAGLIKATLALQHRELPPSLNCAEPDPEIDFPSTPFYVNAELTEWSSDAVRRAGVSSFGIGGTNVHVVVEEAPQQRPSASRHGQLLVLSARTPAALERATANLAVHLRERPELDLADVAHTLQVGRRDFDHRRTVAGRGARELVEALDAVDPRRVRTSFEQSDDRPVVFLFPGQGAQYVDMAKGLYACEPALRADVDRAAEILEPHLGLDLRTVLYPDDGGRDAAEELLGQTWITQPALFVVEYALARLWMKWGVRPSAMIGHSIGEYVAATLASVFTLEDALGLVAARGRLMQDRPPGDMLAVPLPAGEVEPLLGDALSLAAVNEPSACVVSGPAGAIASLREELRGRRVASRELRTSHAFHSAMMEPILDVFAERVGAVKRGAPALPFLSTLTGTWIKDDEATDPDYWARHLRHTVRFAAGVQELLAEPRPVFLEVGPGNALTTLATRMGRGQGGFAASLRHARAERPDYDCVLDALGTLWRARVPIDWKAFRDGEERRRVPLPTYPFERESFWIEPGGERSPCDEGKRPDVGDWFYVHGWTRSAPPLLLDPDPAASDFLILADRGGLGEALAARLRALGKEVAILPAGETPERVPEVVLHLGGADPAGDDALERGLFSLLALGQAIESTEPVRLFTVTRGVHAIVGDEEISPEKAALLGVCRSIAQERANVACQAVDLDGDDDVEHLLLELAADSAEPVVAYRGKHRWSPALMSIRVPAPAEPPRLLRQGGHYLITGGLGSTGLEVAECLARAVRAKLVLVGRSALGDTDPRREKLGVLEELGAECMLARADVSDRDGMEAVLRAAEERFGPLHGVVHAAGAEKTMALLADADPAYCAAQLEPKRAGLAVLEELLEERDLDFCLVQSSLASQLGVLGMVGYVAAHHLVDAFVERHNATRRLAWTRVNWDNWLTWREPEFAHGEGRDAFFMTPEEGAKALLRVLDLPAGAQLAVSTGDLNARIERWAGGRREEPEKPTASLHSRPELRNDYAAPSTLAQRALVVAWGEVLGIGDVGVHDDFFELGGDSVLGLQVVAKAARAGLHVTPAQIFEHPTIAALAQVAGTRGHTEAEQGPVTGAAPLLPIQRWFFEADYPDPQHFNLPMLFEVPADAGAALLEEVLADVVAHHDALRLRFVEKAGVVEQTHAEEPGPVRLVDVDLSSTAAAERDAAMMSCAIDLHADLDLAKGPLLRAAVFRIAGEPSRFLWVVHHLLVDVVSWRILLEDFHTALEQRRAGEAVALAPKTTSFQRWAEALDEYAQSDALAAELAHWRQLADADAPPLPRDCDGGANDLASARTVKVALDGEKTRALLQDVPRTYGTRIDEVLLTAWALACSKWAGGESVLVDLEGHGREDVVADLDLSRTVGWLTTLYPALLSLEQGRSPGEALKAIKEALRAIPSHGIGFGLLRYLRRDAETAAALRALPRPEASFLYLGRFDVLAKATGLRLLQEVSGPPASPAAPRGHLLEITSYVMDGRLHVELTYSANRHREETAGSLARSFLAELEVLVGHCLDPDSGGHTPSDFPAARVSQADLDSLLAKLEDTGAGS